MFCPNCGANLSDTAKFCTKCGEKIQIPEMIPAPQPVPVPVEPAKQASPATAADDLAHAQPVGELSPAEPEHDTAQTEDRSESGGAVAVAVEPEAVAAPTHTDGDVESVVTLTYTEVAEPVATSPGPVETSALPEDTPASGRAPIESTTLPEHLSASSDAAEPAEPAAEPSCDSVDAAAQAEPVPMPARHPVPEGYRLDPKSGFYYISKPGYDPQTGSPALMVSYFDTVTGKSQTVSYPAPRLVSPSPAAQVQPSAAPPYPSPQRPAEKKSGKGAIAVVLLLFFAAVIAAAAMLGLHKKLPFFSKPDKPVESTSESVSVASPASSRAERAESSEPAEAEVVSEPSTGPRTAVAPGHPIPSWVDFPHTSEYYMKVQEDSTHIYFLEPFNHYYWEGTLFRMDKSDDPIIENLSDYSSGDYRCSSFALVEDDIYFSVPLWDGSDRAGYFRVPKTGGEAELLFVQEIALMLYQDGALYLMFDYQQAIGIYRPAFDQVPELIPLARSGDVDHEYIFYFPSFSVHNDWLYYGEVWEEYCTYTRINLSTREQEVLFSGQDLGQPYTYNMIYDGDNVYYNQMDFDSGMNYLRTAPVKGRESQAFSETQLPAESAQYLFLAKVGDTLVYQDGIGSYSKADIGALSQGEMFYTTYSDAPYAISEHWVFFPNGEIVDLFGDRRLASWNCIDGPAFDIGEGYELASELGERYPDQYGVALS